MVQIRLFHDIDYYLCIAYDLRDLANYKSYAFLLTHDDMVKETKLASAAHGTKTVNEKNKNVELRAPGGDELVPQDPTVSNPI